jgi:sugar lactone lactonase YvrE
VIARLFVVAIVSLVCVCGCSQATAPVVHGSALTTASDLGRIAAGSLPTVKFFNTPTAGSWPDYIVAGPQGALWFSEFDSDKIGRITTAGQITEFPLPDTNDIEGIAAGADGNLWFTEPGQNRIGRITPSGLVTAFPIGNGNPSPRGITAGPDGNVWYVEYYTSYIGRVTPAGTITRFQIPDASSYPWDITTGSDGNLWFTESANNRIGRFDARTLRFKPSLAIPTALSTPWGIMSAPDKHIWFTERRGDQIAAVGKGKIFEFPIQQPGSYPEEIAAGSDGDLWFTEGQAAGIGRIEPTTGKFDQVITLPRGSIPTGIASGPDKNIWFTIASYTNPSQIGEVVLH